MISTMCEDPKILYRMINYVLNKLISFMNSLYNPALLFIHVIIIMIEFRTNYVYFQHNSLRTVSSRSVHRMTSNESNELINKTRACCKVPEIAD